MKCQTCKKRESVTTFYNSTTDYTHGFGQKLCRQCYIEKIENHIKVCQDNLKDQKKLLKQGK